MTSDEIAEAKLVDARSYDHETMCARCGKRWGSHNGSLCKDEEGTFMPKVYGKIKPEEPMGETAGFKANLSRYDIEKAENWRKIAVDIPFIPLPKGWLI